MLHPNLGQKTILTSTSFLVKVFLRHRLGLYDQTVPAFSPHLALVVPFVPNKCLPYADHLFPFPASLNGLFHANIYSERLEDEVSAVYGSQVAPRGDVVEVERV